MACLNPDPEVVTDGQAVTWGLARALPLERDARVADAVVAAERALQSACSVDMSRSIAEIKTAVRAANDAVRKAVQSGLDAKAVAELESRLRLAERDAEDRETQLIGEMIRRAAEASTAGKLAQAEVLARRSKNLAKRDANVYVARRQADKLDRISLIVQLPKGIGREHLIHVRDVRELANLVDWVSEPSTFSLNTRPRVVDGKLRSIVEDFWRSDSRVGPPPTPPTPPTAANALRDESVFHSATMTKFHGIKCRDLLQRLAEWLGSPTLRDPDDCRQALEMVLDISNALRDNMVK